MLENPEIKYRPLNYWGWLEKIEPEEVKWQIREMYKAGLRGYVMHARGGLETSYMGEEWLNSIKAMIKQGNELGMFTVIDDEDGWPSGFGAGKVNSRGEEYWLKWLECEKTSYQKIKTSVRTLGVYTLKKDVICRIRDISKMKEIEGELIHIYYNSSSYYVDNLDPKVVKEFINASYEEYHKRFSSEFGIGIKGIFSDEPQIARGQITWSSILPREFQKKFGYDLIEVLPALYFEINGYEKIRHDFWSLVSKLFIESYSKQIGEWCKNHNIAFMGHTAEEDGLSIQMMSSGSTMPFYEYMQIPGIDWLQRIPVNNMTVKQVTSVAQQLGKERILSEMFGCAGWNVSFEELKWIGEWHYVLGINLMLQHLGLYSLKGSRKREYPASLFYQQPWWSEYKVFNDYFAKLSKLMTESEPVIDLLVIHPIRSVWIAFSGLNHKRANDIDKEFKELTESLLNLNYDFHYGDEEIVLRYGKVEGKNLIIGMFSYKAVIIPSSLSMDKNTVGLLMKFADNGGKIISIGLFPHLVSGSPDSKIDKLKQKVHCVEKCISQIESALGSIIRRKIHILNHDGSFNRDIYCCARKMKEKTFYFIVNTSKEKSYNVIIKIDDDNVIYRLDILSYTKKIMGNLDNVHFEPAESILLVSHKSCIEYSTYNITNNLENCIKEPKPKIKEKISLDGRWNVVEADNNTITLDYCRFSIDNGVWEEEIPVIFLQEKLLSLGRPVDIAMKFRFILDFNIRSRLYLVLEEPDKFIIYINGNQLEYLDDGWWIDKSFRKISIENLVVTGENEIILKRNFYCSEKVYRIKNDKIIHEAESNRITVETELESIYLLGNFSVDIGGDVIYIDKRAVFTENAFKLTAPRGKVIIENLVTQGYPFFAGKFKVSKKFDLKGFGKDRQEVELRFNRPDSIITRVYINEVEVKTFLWAPYRVDITEFVREGENDITVEIINSCRNLLGPHHHSNGEMYCVGPQSYKDINFWTDKYCFVRFGISGLAIYINYTGLLNY